MEGYKQRFYHNVVVSSPQCAENTAFFSSFPFGGIQGALLVIPLKLQGKTSTTFYGTA